MKDGNQKLLGAFVFVAITAYALGKSHGIQSMAVKLSSATSTELAVYLAAQDYFSSRH